MRYLMYVKMCLFDVILARVVFSGARCYRHGFIDYHKVSNIRRIKSPNLNVSRLVVQLSLPNPMKPGVKSRMKM